MRNLKQIILSVGITALIGCGGGGGGGSSACSALKINGGESCQDGGTSLVLVDIYQPAGSFYCTGTIISQTTVLTAAHCLEGRISAIDVVGRTFRARAAQYFIHPNYRGSKNGFDLAVVKLSEPVSIAPTPLLVSKGAPASGEELVAYGYGIDESGTDAIQRVRAGEEPLKATYLSFAENLGGVFYQTVSLGSGNTCKGDSGGPILAKNENGQWGIIAVTSFSPLVSNERPCIPTVGGTLAVQSPTQSTTAMNFILSVAPDAALN
jgi:hypothetical protein